MNARTHKFSISVDETNCQEFLSAILHTVFFHRSTGKFSYVDENNYSIGPIGFEDVDCELLDLTYVRAVCPELNANIQKEICQFHEKLANPMNRDFGGQLHLEFFEKRRPTWPLRLEQSVPWEVWTFQLNLVDVLDRGRFLEKLSSSIVEKIMLISEAITSTEYVPKIPVFSDLSLIFDTRYAQLQPYLHRVYSTVNGETKKPVPQALSRMFKETFPL